MLSISSRSRLVAAASPFAIAATLVTSSTAFAQDAPAVPVVTADPQAPDTGRPIRKMTTPPTVDRRDRFPCPLRSATSTKKRQDQIVEAVNAEDIGKLPDNTSLSRLRACPALPPSAPTAAPTSSRSAASVRIFR